MKHIVFNPQFVNAAGDDLIPGKIHTIRQNFFFWKRFEGKEVALFTWEGKPYQKGSTHKVFCVKRIVSVQDFDFSIDRVFTTGNKSPASIFKTLAKNDGFCNLHGFYQWFYNGKYKPGKMAIIHFTDFRY